MINLSHLVVYGSDGPAPFAEVTGGFGVLATIQLVLYK
jgi:hypothetical protein